MKFYLSLFLLFCTFFLTRGQTTKIIYQDSIGYPATPETFFTKRIIEFNEKITVEKKFNAKNYLIQTTEFSDFTKKIKSGWQKTYYENGQVKSQVWYQNNLKTKRYTSYYQNGQVKEEGDFVYDKKNKKIDYLILNYYGENGEKLIANGNGSATMDSENGTETGRFSDGKKEGTWEGMDTRIRRSFIEEYQAGEFVSGYTIDSLNQKIDYKKPIINLNTKNNRGIDDFYNYIIKNLSDLKYNINFYVLLQFNVTSQGKVTHVIVDNSIFPEIENKIVQLIYNYKDFIPMIVKGIPIEATFHIPVQAFSEEE